MSPMHPCPRKSMSRFALLLLWTWLGCGPAVEADGGAWRPAFEAGLEGWFMDVWGPGNGTLVAVGGSPKAGKIMHFDGGEWRAARVPDGVPLINWVHGWSARQAVAVGGGGSVLWWNGKRWSAQSTPTSQDLWGVWGARPNDVWAVGGSGRAGSEATLLRYDGTEWTQQTLPAFQKAGVRALFKVWGTAADNVYAVGQNGAAVHWDGKRWREELAGASDDLIALWGTGPDRVVAVGGRGNGIVSLWDGKRWRTKDVRPLPGLNGVWLRDPAHAHVVGELGAVAVVDLESFDYDDHSYPTDLTLHAVFGDTSGRLTAVGGNLSRAKGPFEGLVLWRELQAGE